MKVSMLNDKSGFYTAEPCSKVDFLLAIAKQYGGLKDVFDKESIDTTLNQLIGCNYTQATSQIKREYWSHDSVDRGIPFLVSALDPKAVSVMIILIF